MFLAGTAGIHLRRTLESGQAFRWTWTDEPGTGEVAVGVVGRHVLRLAPAPGGIRLLSPATPAVREACLRYLGVAPAGQDVHQVERALATDPVLARILPHTHGLAILAQDPWEVLISFIVSQNNNIPKIRRSIERLARALGEPLDRATAPAGPGRGGAGPTHAFPSPERLAAARLRTLRACHLGYRAPYVRAAARLVAAGRIDLDMLRRVPEAEARDVLRGIPGVGEKVGDCILLFGFGHAAAFPVDVWVRRAVERLYFRGRTLPPREIRTFARQRFGLLAGYAQQHLFTYARAHLRADRSDPAL